MNALRWACVAGLLLGCGSSVPVRYVVERDIDGYAYRRYQRVLDVEFAIEGNPAVGHTAAYLARDRRDVAVATAFVTVYERARGLAAEVKRRLDTLGSYEITTVEFEGDYVHALDGGGHVFWLWVSGNRVVKLGAPEGGRIPEELAETYLDVYPSDLDEHGRARPGTASAGDAAARNEEVRELDVPKRLQEGAPR